MARLIAIICALQAGFSEASASASISTRKLRGPFAAQWRPFRKPPNLQTFSGTLSLHPFDGQQSQFRSASFKFNKPSNQTMLTAIRRNFDFVGPTFEHLGSVTVCDGSRCSLSYNNGTGCAHGVLPNFETLFKLWHQMQEVGISKGVSEVAGRNCERWLVNDTKDGMLEMCIDDRDIPLSAQFKPTASVGQSNVGAYSQNLTFENVSIGIADIGSESMVCTVVAPKLCNSAGKVALLVYRATNYLDQGELANLDTSDLLGAGVTLGSPVSPSFIGKKYYEFYEVDADSAFGPLRDCNYKNGHNVCSRPQRPGFAKSVSRSSSEQLSGSPGSWGQCDSNELVGSWYTFPEEGRCGINESIGDNGCTWKVRQHKAISMLCMMFWNSTSMTFDLTGGSTPFLNTRVPFAGKLEVPLNASGWFRAWQEDYQKAPFPNLMDHIDAAFNACPDIQGFKNPSATSHLERNNP